MEIKLVITDSDINIIKKLFFKYQNTLSINHHFEDFSTELENFPGDYTIPLGRLYLAIVYGKPAGCIALRPFGTERCELKRLYICKKYRGQGIPKILAMKLLADAKEIGYQEILLNVLPSMKAAIHLCQSLGFKEIPSYQNTPIIGAKYMKLKLN